MKPSAASLSPVRTTSCGGQKRASPSTSSDNRRRQSRLQLPKASKSDVVDDDPLITPKRIVIAAALILALVVGRWGYNTLSYWRVQWKPHMGPEARFRVAFPGDP